MRFQFLKTKILCLLLSLTVVLCGCANVKQPMNKDVIWGESKYKDFITVDVFSMDANYEGLQTGWFAQIVKEKFNMQLNIISPNLVAGGNSLFLARSIAGNLGDLVIFNVDKGLLQEVVTANLLYDMTSKVRESKVFASYPAAIEKISGLVSDGLIYCIPGRVSTKDADEPSELSELTFGSFVRWDYYLEEGTPEIATLEDLLPILRSIQDKHPLSDSGKPSYAISLFGDWDDDMMNLAQQPARMYGYSEMGFVLHKVDGSDYDSIIEEDSIYVRGLKFFFDANQMGIVDPESTTQNWDTLWNKYVDGAVYFSPWTFLGTSAFNTTEHITAGKGFKFIPAADMEIISSGASTAGNTISIGIGSKAQDPDRMYDFIEWIYSPEGILANSASDGGGAGPIGLTWEFVDGESRLTEFGERAFADTEGTLMLAEWGGGTWRSGASALNYKGVMESDINPDTRQSYSYIAWPSYQAHYDNKLDRSWQEHYGAMTMLDLVTMQELYLVEPATSYTTPTETMYINSIRNQCDDIIVNYSWKMVFAKDEASFYQLLEQMQKTVRVMGYDDVLAFDMECARELNVARDAVRNNKNR